MTLRLKRITKRIFPYLLIIIAAIFMLAPQIHSQAFVSGLDYYFHMSRAYETAMQIKTGHFSYFLSLFSWGHNARIVNALYGPVGGYLSGLILLLAKNWYRWEISMSLITLMIAGMTMYHLGRYWHVTPVINFLISILYMLSSPINDFVFKQTFSGVGAALLPLVILMTSEALSQKDINPVKLALVLILLIEIHLMTFVLSIIFMAPCLLLSFVVARRSRLQLVKHVFEAAVLTVVLSFNVWGAILEVLTSNRHHIIPTFPGTNLGKASYNTIMNTYPQTPLLQTPSVIGLIVLILIMVTAILWLLDIKHVTYITNVFMIFGMLFIWMSSKWFPWPLVSRRIPLFTTIIQFPKRFLPMGISLVYFLLGVLLTKVCQETSWPIISEGALVLLLMIATGWCWHNNYNYLQYKIHTYQSSAVIDWVDMNWRVNRNPNRLRSSFRIDHPDRFLNIVSKAVPDYVPTSVNYYQASQYNLLDPYSNYRRIYYRHVPFKWQLADHGEEIIKINSRRDRWATVPFAKYSHTQVAMNHHLISPTIDKIGAMRIHLRTGQNRLLIKYQPSQLFKVGILISIIAWLTLFFWIIYDNVFNILY